MKQLVAWTGSADSTITSEAVMAMAEKFNTGQEVCLQILSARGVMQVKEGTSRSWRRVGRHDGCGAATAGGYAVKIRAEDQRWRVGSWQSPSKGVPIRFAARSCCTTMIGRRANPGA